MKITDLFPVRWTRLGGMALIALFLFPNWALPIESFDPSRNQSLMELIPPADRSKVAETLKRAGANWQELAKALQQAKPEHQPGMIALITSLRSVDLFSPTAEILLEEVAYAYKAWQDLPKKAPEEVFPRYILPFRISSEWFIPWRLEFYEQLHPLVKDAKTSRETAEKVNKWVKRNIKVKSDRGGRWPQSPILTLRGRNGNQVSVSVFTVAALRSVGIASRIVTVDFFGDSPGGSTWVEFLADQEWLPLYPDDPANLGEFRKLSREHPRAIPLVYADREENITARYTPVGALKVATVTDSLSNQGKSIDFSVGVFNDGSWQTVTDRMGFSFAADTSGVFQIELGVGNYLAQAEIDKYLIFLKRFTIEEGKTTRIEINPKSWEYTEDIYDTYR